MFASSSLCDCYTVHIADTLKKSNCRCQHQICMSPLVSNRLPGTPRYHHIKNNTINNFILFKKINLACLYFNFHLNHKPTNIFLHLIVILMSHFRFRRRQINLCVLLMLTLKRLLQYHRQQELQVLPKSGIDNTSTSSMKMLQFKSIPSFISLVKEGQRAVVQDKVKHTCCSPTEL